MAGSKGIRAGRAFVELGVDDRLTRGLRAAEKRLKAFGGGIQAIGKRALALGTGVVTPLVGAVKVFAGMGDALDKMAARTGVSVETLSELGFAAEQSGADLETLETGLRKMQASIVDAAQGSKTAAASLSVLGLSVETLGKLSPERQFKLIADRLARVANPTLRAALAMELFGKSGTRLLPMLENGAAGIEALQQQARDFGLTVSTQSAKDAALLNDTLNILWRTLTQATFTIGSALAPLLTDLAGRAARVVTVVTEWIGRNRGLIVTIFKVSAAVAFAGAALVGAGLVIKGLAAAFGGLATAVTALSVVFKAAVAGLGLLLSPIGLVTAAAVGLGAALWYAADHGASALDWLGGLFSWLKSTALGVFEGISDALAAGDIALAAQVLWAGVKVVWEKGIRPLREAWIAFTTGIHRFAINAFAGVKSTWINVSTWFYKNFPKTTGFIAKQWATMTADMKSSFSVLRTSLTKMWISLQGFFGGLTKEQVADAKKMAEEELSLELAKIDEKRQKDIEKAERKSRMTPEELEAEKARDLAQVEADRVKQLAELDEAYGQRVAAAEEALAKAEKALADARARARERKEAAAKAAPAAPRRRPDALAPDLDARIAGLGDLLAEKISTTGTFNPLAVLGLGPGNNPMERTARATEEIVRVIKRPDENGRRLRFGA